MSPPDGELPADAPPRYAIVAGFGVPGRNCAEWLGRHGWSFVVIERNDQTVDRCGKVGVPIVAGDATDEATLRRAGIDRADLLAVTIPDEAVALAVIAAARRLSPRVRILARVYHISVAFEAVKQGADETIVAEELAAREFTRLLDGGRSSFHAQSDAGEPRRHPM
jgi:voltage-gated potassium channel Kch